MIFRSVSISILLLLLFVSACSEQQRGVVLKAGQYNITISNDPDPLEVGETAQFLISIRDQEGQTVEGCNARFRQSMPGMEMSMDNVFVELAATGKGRYQGRSSEFHMGGDWVMDFEVTCAGDAQAFKLERHLEWPE